MSRGGRRHISDALRRVLSSYHLQYQCGETSRQISFLWLAMVLIQPQCTLSSMHHRSIILFGSVLWSAQKCFYASDINHAAAACAQSLGNLTLRTTGNHFGVRALKLLLLLSYEMEKNQSGTWFIPQCLHSVKLAKIYAMKSINHHQGAQNRK